MASLSIDGNNLLLDYSYYERIRMVEEAVCFLETEARQHLGHEYNIPFVGCQLLRISLVAILELYTGPASLAVSKGAHSLWWCCLMV